MTRLWVCDNVKSFKNPVGNHHKLLSMVCPPSHKNNNEEKQLNNPVNKGSIFNSRDQVHFSVFSLVIQYNFVPTSGEQIERH